MRLVSRNIVVESGIIDVFFYSCDVLCIFLGLELWLGFVRCMYVRKLGLGLGLGLVLGLGSGLGFVDTRKINCIF